MPSPLPSASQPTSQPTNQPTSLNPLLTAPSYPGDHFAITIAPLDLEAVYQQATDPANGAIVVMSGMVRQQTNGKTVLSLQYQAYEPMAMQVFKQIAAEIRTTWPEVTHVIIHHRIGRLEIGELSVLIAIGCPHRASAFAACQYTIDTIKERAPIWKKEYFQGKDGAIQSTWVQCC